MSDSLHVGSFIDPEVYTYVIFGADFLLTAKPDDLLQVPFVKSKVRFFDRAISPQDEEKVEMPEFFEKSAAFQEAFRNEGGVVYRVSSDNSKKIGESIKLTHRRLWPVRLIVSEQAKSQINLMHEDASKADEVTNAKQAFASLQQFFEVEPLRSGIDFIEARWWDARGDHSLNVPTREFEISELLSCVEVNLNLFPPVSLKEPVLGPSETLGQETISLMHYICGANKRNQCFLATHDAGTQAEISVLFERHGLAVGSFHNQEQFEARCMKLMDGFTTTWFPNGQKELEMRYEGSDLVDAIGWQPDGECSETNLSDGNGVYVRYFPQGGKSWERNYQGKSLHGKSIRWRSDGSMQWDHEYKEGLADGIWVEWYPDGNKKSERNYLFGKLSGPASEWHENGTKSVDTDYLDDKRHGAFARWHANGKPKWKGLFVEGQRDGEWTSWDDDGVKWYDELYERGELIERNL